MGWPVIVDLCEPRPFSATYLLVMLIVLIGSLHCRHGQCTFTRSVEIYAASTLVMVAFTVVTVGIVPTRLPHYLEQLPCLRAGLGQHGSDFILPKTDTDTDPFLITKPEKEYPFK